MLLGAVRKKRNGACALDRFGQLALMLCAGAGHTAGQNLAALVDVSAHPGIQIPELFIVDVFNLIDTECTYFPAGLAIPAGMTCLTILRHEFLLSGHRGHF